MIFGVSDLAFFCLKSSLKQGQPFPHSLPLMPLVQTGNALTQPPKSLTHVNNHLSKAHPELEVKSA